MALRQHPDKNPNDPDATRRFQQLGDAYNHLNKWFERGSYVNPQSDFYDSFGSFEFGPGPGGFRFGFGNHRGPFAGYDYEDVGEDELESCYSEEDDEFGGDLDDLFST